jgi:hypothetical protein
MKIRLALELSRRGTACRARPPWNHCPRQRRQSRIKKRLRAAKEQSVIARHDAQRKMLSQTKHTSSFRAQRGICFVFPFRAAPRHRLQTKPRRRHSEQSEESLLSSRSARRHRLQTKPTLVIPSAARNLFCLPMRPPRQHTFLLTIVVMTTTVST